MILKGFVGGAYEGRSDYINPQTCVNLFPVVDRTGGKNVVNLVGTPGLIPKGSYNSYAVRGLIRASGTTYLVSGNKFLSFDGEHYTPLGTLSSTTSNPVHMEENGVQVMIVDGEFGYIYTISGSTFAQISDPDFPTPSSLAYQDGYFIVSKADSDEFYISSLYDGKIWDALDFGSAEANPDIAVAIISDHRELWVFGEKTTEVFYNSGNADFPFERISGSTQEIGCGAKFSVAQGDNTLFWLDNRGFLIRANGYMPVIVSTRNVEYQWAGYSKTSDAIGFCYDFDGHVMYQITFPTAGKTWVFDVSTNMWHERSSYTGSTYTGSVGRHRANCYVWDGANHIVGDYDNGQLYYLDIDKYSDAWEPSIRERTFPVISSENKRIFFRSLEIDFEPGTGTLTNSPAAMLQWSNDGGKTWGNEVWRRAGNIGEYRTRLIWRNLGSARNRVFRLRMSDEFKVVIAGAYIDMIEGRN